MAQRVLLAQHALGQVVRQLLAHLRELLRVGRVEPTDLVGVGGVGERGLGGLVALPHVWQLVEEAHVEGHHPVRIRARKVAVDDLAHRVLLGLEHLGREVEHNVEHLGLRGERGGAVLRHGVRRDLRVHVLRAQPVDDHQHQRLGQRQLARQPVEVLLGVARRPARHAVAVEDGGGVAGAPHEELHVLDRLHRRLALVAVVRDHDALAHGAVDLLVHEQQQHAVEVEHLAHELLAVLVEQDALDGLLDVDALAQVGHELHEVLDVLVDRLEEVVHAADQHTMRLPHLTVALNQLRGGLDLVLEERRRLEKGKIEQHLTVYLLIQLVRQRKQRWDVICKAQQLGNERLTA